MTIPADDTYAPSAVIGRRYRILGRLGAGGMGAVYRAYDRLTGQHVALKQVLAPTDSLQFNSRQSMGGANTNARLALAQEFRSLATLRHPNIIRVRDYGFDSDQQPFFTMDMLDSPQTLLEAGQDKPLSVQINLIVQMLQALVYLHRRGIIHRDLKPSNVLVSGGVVRVLDFGLSISAQQTGEVSGTAGTLAYMAPELLAETAPPSIASDLYAVGVMLYEVFIGRHPFSEKTNLYAMIFAVLNDDPNLDALPYPALISLMERLMAKDPERRPPDARTVIDRLCEATDQPPPPESVAIRESFLQGARLVGRQTELAHLSQALDSALARSSNAWVAAGESGVGKSRLLEELQTLALVRGALTLRGQAVAEGGGPYEVWREPLRRLAVNIPDLTDREAAVLKGLVPDLESLIERPIPDVASVDPGSARARVLTTVSDLIKRYDGSLVFILEDCHWAGAESLELLAYLVKMVIYAMDLRVLIVVSHREGESPMLYAPEMNILRLRRFDRLSMAELSESMLGEAGRSPELLEFLETETEGNALFVVEVVRALAQEAGQLERVAGAPLPETLITGGVANIIGRRLAKVPARARPLLDAAALMGRQPDLDVLAVVDTAIELEDWLDACTEINIVDFFDGHWRFAHEKVRETLIDALSSGEQRSLHRRIAIAYEKVHADKPDQAATLAYHWSKAGDIGKEVGYTAIAGTQAMRAGAYQEALRLLSRARELTAKMNTQPDGDSEHRITGISLRQAVLERQLAEVHYGLGNLAESRAHALTVMCLLRAPVRETQAKMGLDLLVEIARQVGHRLQPARYAPSTAPQANISTHAALAELINAHERYALLTYLGSETIPGIFAVVRGLNLAEKSGGAAEIARLSAAAGLGAGVVRLFRIADYYMRRGQTLSATAGDLPTRLWVQQIAAIYFTGRGQWEQARAAYIEGIEIADRIKDRIRLQDCARFLAWMTTQQGEFSHALQMQNDMIDLARRGQDPLYEAYSLVGRSEILLVLGRATEAITDLEAALLLMADRDDIPNVFIWAYGLLGLAKWQLGEIEPATRAARQAIMVSQRVATPTFWAISGAAAAAEVEIAQWEAAPADATERAEAQAAARMMRGYAWRYPMGEPRSHRITGLYWWGCGAKRRARAAWSRALESAQRLAMPYEAGLAHYELGRHADQPSDRRAALREARDIFGQLGAVYALQKTREALER